MAVAAEQLVGPDIPDHHGASAVVTFRDGAFKVEVRDGMIFHLHGQTLVGWVEGRTFGDSPGFKHTADLEPEIVMQPRRVVTLNHEA